jgi:prevent-host-death family protein
VREIGAFEAKNTLSVLLDLVESGEEIIITRHSEELARIVPPRGTINREGARKAAQRIREMSAGVALDGLSIKDIYQRGAPLSVVLDASLTLSWFFADERTPAADAVLDQVVEQGAIVPAVWKLGIANGLAVAIRRKRIDVAFRDSAIS